MNDEKQIRKEFDKAYPFNAMEDARIDPAEDPKKFLDALASVPTIDFRTMYLIEGYYRDGKPISKLAKEVQLSNSYVYQVIGRGLRSIGNHILHINRMKEQARKEELSSKELEDLSNYRKQLVEEFKKTGKYSEEMEIEFGHPTSYKRIHLVGPFADYTLIGELNLSVRTNNCLKRAGVSTIADLVSHTEEELAKVRNLGKRGLKEVKEKLADNGLSLKLKQDS